MYTLFTTKTCKYCPEIKSLLRDNSIKYTETDCTSDPGRSLLIDLGGRGVPTLLDKKGNLHTGKDDIIKFLKLNHE